MDRSREAALRDLTAWAHEYGLTFALRGETEAAKEVVENGDVALVLVPLSEHITNDPDAEFADFADGSIWWQK